MTHTISGGRGFAFYGGTVSMVVGGAMLLSSMIPSSTMLSDGSAAFSSIQAATVRAIMGIVLLVAGFIVRRVGVRGLAGSGLVLEARRTSKRVVMLECAACGKLSAENASFCQACGTKL